MYLAIKNIPNLINKQIRLILKKINLLLTLSFLFFATVIYAEEKFVGFIESLEGKANKEGKEKIIHLNEFDQIFINQKISIDLNSSATISFIDNSVLTLDGGSEFTIKKFDNISQEPSFILSIINGNFTFESGRIAKVINGVMKVILPGKNKKDLEVDSTAMILGLRGTLITGSNSDDTKQVALVEDSMGKVGTLDIDVGGQTITVTKPSTGINISENNEIQNTILSDEETKQIKNKVKEIAVNSATQSEEKIERAISKQLALGTIPDSNGDGIADSKDIEAYKAELMNLKETKLDYLVNQSGVDSSLISEIIINSDSNQSMQLMEGMMENNQDNVSILMDQITKDGFDVFTHMGNANEGNFEDLRGNIVSGMMNDQSEFSVNAMAKVMAASDEAMGLYLVNEITSYTPTDPEMNLSMNILASFNEIAPDKMTTFYVEAPDMMNTLTTSAFESATEDDIEKISSMMQQAPGENTAFLMQNMVEHNPEMIAGVYNDLSSQDFDLFDHIETAKNQTPQTTIQDPANFTAETNILVNPTENYVNQDQYINKLKNEMFEEIINNSEGTAAEIAGEIMMNTSGGNTQLMMENLVETNPGALVALMDNFAEESFDVFDHIKTNVISQNITPTDTFETNTQTPGETIKLTKDEKKELRAERKLQKKTERKAERILAKKMVREKIKRDREFAKQQGLDSSVEIVSNDVATDQFKAGIFKEMLTNADDATMNTMAKLASTGDSETASLIFKTVMYEQNTNKASDSQGKNLALNLLNNLSNMESETVDNLFEDQEALVSNMVNTALTNITSTDSDAVANIISSSGNDQMNEAVFSKMSSNGNQAMTSSVFTTLAESTTGSEAIVAMASKNQNLYANIAQDVSSTSMTAASLLTNISNTENYNTNTATTNYVNTNTGETNTASTTNTNSAGSSNISWATYPTTSGTYTTSSYISITANATSPNGVTYSASDLPDGLTMDYMSGLIFGTPSAAGSWTTTITAYDKLNTVSFITASLNFTITIGQGVSNNNTGAGNLTWSTTPTAPTTLTKDSLISPIYLYTMGQVGTVTYTVTGLPMGLYLSGSEIKGAPMSTSAAGTNVMITAMDTNNNTVTTSLNFPMVSSGAAAASGPTWVSASPPVTLTKSTQISDITLSATGTAPITYSADANLSTLGLTVSSAGIISGTPLVTTMFSTTVVFTATDITGTSTKSVTFPQVGAASETVSFTTTPGTVASVSQGQNIFKYIYATASQGSTLSYSFISTNNGPNAVQGITGGYVQGTQILITGNNISGIAPRLYVAATYSFAVTASINAGTITNTKTFSIAIAKDSTCISATNNICP